jgi:hypothetical protein
MFDLHVISDIRDIRYIRDIQYIDRHDHQSRDNITKQMK